MANLPTALKPVVRAPVMQDLPEPTALVRHAEQAPLAGDKHYARILSAHEALQRLCVTRPPQYANGSVDSLIMAGATGSFSALTGWAAAILWQGQFPQQTEMDPLMSFTWAMTASGFAVVSAGIAVRELADAATSVFKLGTAIPAGATFMLRNYGFTNQVRWDDLLFGNKITPVEDLDALEAATGTGFVNGVTIEECVVDKEVSVVNERGRMQTFYDITIKIKHNGKEYALSYPSTTDVAIADYVANLPQGSEVSLLVYKTKQGQIKFSEILDLQLDEPLDAVAPTSDTLDTPKLQGDQSSQTDAQRLQPYHYKGLRIDTDIIGESVLNALPEDKRRDVLVSLVSMIFDEPDKVRRNGYLQELVTEHLTILEDHYRSGVTRAIVSQLGNPEKEIRDSVLKVLDQLRRFGLLSTDDKEFIRAKIHELETSGNPDVRHDMQKVANTFQTR